MDAKFKKIASFLETLPIENVLNADEEALLLVGGTGDGPSTNNGCTNNQCSNNSNRIDHGCTNEKCSNVNC